MLVRTVAPLLSLLWLDFSGATLSFSRVGCRVRRKIETCKKTLAAWLARAEYAVRRCDVQGRNVSVGVPSNLQCSSEQWHVT